MLRAIAITLACVPALAGAAGCGGDDGDQRTFTAVEIVSELNARGTRLMLGAPLTTNREDTEIYALGTTSKTAPGVTRGGGSLTVTADADAGLAEYQRCEEAASLLCFRANNVVLAFEEELSPKELAALASALRRIAGLPATPNSR